MEMYLWMLASSLRLAKWCPDQHHEEPRQIYLCFEFKLIITPRARLVVIQTPGKINLNFLHVHWHAHTHTHTHTHTRMHAKIHTCMHTHTQIFSNGVVCAKRQPDDQWDSVTRDNRVTS